MSDQIVTCRTLTANPRSKCYLPDLNRRSRIGLLPAGPQPGAPDHQSVASRTSIESFCARKNVKGYSGENARCFSDRMSEYLADSMSEFMSDRISKVMPDRMSELMPDRMPEQRVT